jgi:NADPH:quinone reductase
MPTSRSMRALVLERHSGPFILNEAELPTITAGQLLVRVKASGVNPLDVKIRTGNAAHARVELPAILGMDLAGVVEAVGPDVTAFKPVQFLNRRLRRSADSG